jgi:hypothetical protein
MQTIRLRRKLEERLPPLQTQQQWLQEQQTLQQALQKKRKHYVPRRPPHLLLQALLKRHQRLQEQLQEPQRQWLHWRQLREERELLPQVLQKRRRPPPR